MKNLYELIGNVCGINTLLINKAELDAKMKQSRDAALDEAFALLMSMHRKCKGNHNFYAHAANYMREKLR